MLHVHEGSMSFSFKDYFSSIVTYLGFKLCIKKKESIQIALYQYYSFLNVSKVKFYLVQHKLGRMMANLKKNI